MAQQLAFAIVTPYTIQKSRTGAVLSRLLGRTSTELIATQMFALDQEMALAYANTIRSTDDHENELYRKLIRDYISENLSPDLHGHRRRLLMLVFRGQNAVDDIAQVVGPLSINPTRGESIRDTYGDLVQDGSGNVRYFEPAVLIADSAKTAAEDLQLWLDFAQKSQALLQNVCTYDNPEKVQRTLVLIKPDSWRQKSSRPGAIIDMFSRTGLRIIASKLCRISVAQALEFYGPVREVLQQKLAPGIGQRAKELLEQEFHIQLPPESEECLAENIGNTFAEKQFERIIEFMTGRRPRTCPQAELEQPGWVKSLALVYEGEDAIGKIRTVLGPTDPTKAPDGTVRREFGSDVMVNTAHASDSQENALREMEILKMNEGNFVSIVKQALKEIS